MADAADSKSAVGDHVWVQVPSPALARLSPGFFHKGEGFMELLVLIIKHVELVNDLIEALAEAGIPGGTILNSTGMAGVLENMEDAPAYGILRRSFHNEYIREDSKTMLFVLTDEELETARTVIRKKVGDLNRPDTGIMFAVPISFVEGFGG